MITREYIQSNGRGKIQAQLIVDGPRIQRLAVLLAQSHVHAKPAGHEAFKDQGCRGIEPLEEKKTPGWRNGRRSGLKIRWGQAP